MSRHWRLRRRSTPTAWTNRSSSQVRANKITINVVVFKIRQGGFHDCQKLAPSDRSQTLQHEAPFFLPRRPEAETGGSPWTSSGSRYDVPYRPHFHGRPFRFQVLRRQPFLMPWIRLLLKGFWGSSLFGAETQKKRSCLLFRCRYNHGERGVKMWRTELKFRRFSLSFNPFLSFFTSFFHPLRN